MGDIGAFALIPNNKDPGGVGTRLLSSWSSDPDSLAVSWLVSACNGLVDCCLPLGRIH